jgi:hypothetical protein
MHALTPLGRISSRKSNWRTYDIVRIGVVPHSEAIILRDTDNDLLYIGRDAQGMAR